jgi:hypothetical protein
MKLLPATTTVLSVLFMLLISCTIEVAVPIVDTSSPADGDTDVAVDIGEMTITFDRIMDGGVSIDYGTIPGPKVPDDLVDQNGWVDARTYKFEFDPLTASTTYTVTLNPTGQPLDFRTAQGGILEPDTTISFTTAP